MSIENSNIEDAGSVIMEAEFKKQVSNDLSVRENKRKYEADYDLDENPQNWKMYRKCYEKALENLKEEYSYFSICAEKHPNYQTKWEKFKRRRSRKLKNDAIDDNDILPEWNSLWGRYLEESQKNDAEKCKLKIRRALKLPLRSKTPDITIESKKKCSERNLEVTVLSVLNSLVELDTELDNLGPVAVQLLSKAKLYEKETEQNANELLHEDEYLNLFEDALEKLKAILELDEKDEQYDSNIIVQCTGDLQTILNLFNEYLSSNPDALNNHIHSNTILKNYNDNQNESENVERSEDNDAENEENMEQNEENLDTQEENVNDSREEIVNDSHEEIIDDSQDENLDDSKEEEKEDNFIADSKDEQDENNKESKEELEEVTSSASIIQGVNIRNNEIPNLDQSVEDVNSDEEDIDENESQQLVEDNIQKESLDNDTPMDETKDELERPSSNYNSQDNFSEKIEKYENKESISEYDKERYSEQHQRSSSIEKKSRVEDFSNDSNSSRGGGSSYNERDRGGKDFSNSRGSDSSRWGYGNQSGNYSGRNNSGSDFSRNNPRGGTNSDFGRNQGKHFGSDYYRQGSGTWGSGFGGNFRQDDSRKNPGNRPNSNFRGGNQFSSNPRGGRYDRRY